MKPCVLPPVSRPDHRKHMNNARFAISLGAAFALLCAVVFDSREGQAANGLFELLFGGPNYEYVGQAPSASYGRSGSTYTRHRHARRTRTREASARRHLAERRAESRRAVASRPVERHHVAALIRHPTERRNAAPENSATLIRSATSAEARTTEARANATRASETQAAERSHSAICVRACDGFSFRIVAKSSDSAAQETCDRLCPGTQTAAFMLPSGKTRAEDAVAVKGGETYAQFVARIKPDASNAQSCGCPQTAENLSATSTFLSDLTLRPGDTVVTPSGLRVLRQGSRYPFKGSDFLSLAETRSLPRSTRGALAAIDRAIKIPYGRLAVANGDRRRNHRVNL